MKLTMPLMVLIILGSFLLQTAGEPKGFITTAWSQTTVDDPTVEPPAEDAVLSGAEELMKRAAEKGQMSVLDLLRTMGPYFIYPFAAFSIWSLYLILANLLILSESRLVPLRIARQARDFLLKGDVTALRRLVEARSDLLSTMLLAGCTKAGRDPALIETAMEGCLSQYLVRLRNRIRHLADIASIAPMIGLLGTVWGMLKVFQAVAMDANSTMIGNWSSLLAEGVAQAMVTTVVGLVIGIPSLLFYYLFRNKLARIIGRLETFGTDLAELLSQQQVAPTIVQNGLPPQV
jgi:biopolymer transport protein ExbB